MWTLLGWKFKGGVFQTWYILGEEESVLSREVSISQGRDVPQGTHIAVCRCVHTATHAMQSGGVHGNVCPMCGRA